MPSKLPAYQVIRGGLVLDVAKRRTAPADILVKDDAIREVGPPGLAAPEDEVTRVAAALAGVVGRRRQAMPNMHGSSRSLRRSR